MRIIEFVITIIQYILTSIIVFVVLQVLFSAQYNRDLLVATNTISYSAAIFVILTWKLFSWYKFQKQPVILLYGLGAAFIVLTSVSTLIWSDAVLLRKASVVFPESEVLFDPVYAQGGVVNLMLTLLYYFQTIFILFLWGGTILILYYNLRRIGRVKFWVLMSLPVLTFISTLISFYGEIAPTSPVSEAISSNFMIPILILNYSALAVGVVFGLSFLIIGRFLKQGTHARDYMIIAGFGFIIFIWANGATVIQAAYPPYGIATVSAMPLALLMIVTALYYSAVSISQDVTLRRSIRNNIRDMKFLEGIGTAQVEKQIQARVSHLEAVLKVERTELERRSGIQPSIEEQDIRQYLSEVLQEIDKHKSA